MKRQLIIAGLSVALTLPLLAQMRMGGAPAARPMGPARVGPVGPVRTMAVPRPMPRGFSGPVIQRGSGPTFRTSSPFVFNPACDPFVFQCSPAFISSFNGFHSGRRFRRFGRFGRFNQFGFSPFGFSSFGGTPFIGFGGFGYPLFSDYETQATQQPAAANPPVVIYAAPPPSERDFEDEREPRSGRDARDQQPAPPAKAAEPQPVEPVVLIYRDHRREEVTNYAIAGDTLYVFSTHARRKIALSELDLPATEKANDDRGVDFHVPPPHKGT